MTDQDHMLDKLAALATAARAGQPEECLALLTQTGFGFGDYEETAVEEILVPILNSGMHDCLDALVKHPEFHALIAGDHIGMMAFECVGNAISNTEAIDILLTAADTHGKRFEMAKQLMEAGAWANRADIVTYIYAQYPSAVYRHVWCAAMASEHFPAPLDTLEKLGARCVYGDVDDARPFLHANVGGNGAKRAERLLAFADMTSAQIRAVRDVIASAGESPSHRSVLEMVPVFDAAFEKRVEHEHITLEREAARHRAALKKTLEPYRRKPRP